MDEHLEQKCLSEEAIRSSGVSRSRTALYILVVFIQIDYRLAKKKKFETNVDYTVPVCSRLNRLQFETDTIFHLYIFWNIF